MIPQTLKKISKARLPNAPKSLEGSDVGLIFQLKILEYMDFENQELKRGRKRGPDKTK